MSMERSRNNDGYDRDRGDRGGDREHDKEDGRGRRGNFVRKKMDRFSADPTLVIDYKDPQLLRNFISERGKIVPSRLSGNIAKHQRQVAIAIKRARHLALIPFAVTGK